MTEWLHRTFGLSVDEANLLITAVAIVVPLLLAATPVTRRLAVAGFRLFTLRSGLVERRYTRWFSRTYRNVYNIYLDMYDELDLHNTYVALSFRGRKDTEQRLPAALVLADRTLRRMVIIGDPGSGKSTLLKAYGVGILRQPRQPVTSDLRLIGRSIEVPFLVPLRRLARELDAGQDLLAYLHQQVLVHDAGLTPRAAEALLNRLLRERRLLVFLDGLDEVPAAKLDAIRAVVQHFVTDQTTKMPTHLARVVVACRRQNFLGISNDWLPSFARFPHTLSPLRDNEILQYARNLKAKFPPPKTPQSYLSELRTSGTLDYHRTPLVLAISAGLYLGKEGYEIPKSISLLYEAMVVELLSRHDFRLDPVGRSNRFRTKDKHRVLRAFALSCARTGGFAEFTRKELVEFTRRAVVDIGDLKPRQGAELVDEIVTHSGLITEVSDDGVLIIAHRSIHEYLAAAELAEQGDTGLAELLERAGDPEWRQVVLIYSSLRTAQASAFLAQLTERHLELAAHCVALAGLDVAAARPIIDEVTERFQAGTDRSPYLVALLSVTRSGDQAVRGVAVAAVERIMAELVDGTALLQRLDVDEAALLNIIDTLAASDTDEVIALVPRLAGLIPDEPRLVGPLWRCLAVPGIDTRQPVTRIVSRLLKLAIDPACFEELQQQLPGEPPDWLTTQARRQAYPFRRGLGLDTNLVTLLAWADRVGAVPATLNRFLEARRTSPARFARLEADRARTLVVNLFWPATVLSFLGCLAAIVVATGRLFDDWHVMFQPFGWRTLMALLSPMVIAAILQLVVSVMLRVERKDGQRAAGVLGVLEPFRALLVPVLAAAFGLAFAPLLNQDGLWAFVGASSGSMYLLCLVPLYGIFDRQLYLFRPNPYVDVYEDPGSVHWLRTDAMTPAEQRRLAALQARQQAEQLGRVVGQSVSTDGTDVKDSGTVLLSRLARYRDLDS